MSFPYTPYVKRLNALSLSASIYVRLSYYVAIMRQNSTWGSLHAMQVEPAISRVAFVGATLHRARGPSSTTDGDYASQCKPNDKHADSGQRI